MIRVNQMVRIKYDRVKVVDYLPKTNLFILTVFPDMKLQDYPNGGSRKWDYHFFRYPGLLYPFGVEPNFEYKIPYNRPIKDIDGVWHRKIQDVKYAIKLSSLFSENGKYHLVPVNAKARTLTRYATPEITDNSKHPGYGFIYKEFIGGDFIGRVDRICSRGLDGKITGYTSLARNEGKLYNCIILTECYEWEIPHIHLQKI